MKNKTLKAPGGVYKPEQFRDFLLAHLNRIYCAKTHLYERLPELAQEVNFLDLKDAILETWEDIGKQIARTEEIYVLLDEEPPISNSDELIEFLKNGFGSFYEKRPEPAHKDLSILFYLSIIESVELASFQLLQMAAVESLDMRIKRMLQENFDESKAERTLFLQITAIHVS